MPSCKQRCGSVGMIKDGKTGLQRERDPGNHRVRVYDENRLLWEAYEVSGQEKKRFQNACLVLVGSKDLPLMMERTQNRHKIRQNTVGIRVGKPKSKVHYMMGLGTRKLFD
ncbi:hypothetical protein SK128_015958 [Halocaridina rubra]|uniref:Uncharacterized protein n=1 Tax=Halocaridina rubra TaxID=373956 RepID=A0AAN8X812_HALRR